MEHKIMKDLPNEERPYEKCMARGASFLTDAELLAVVLRTGTAGSTSVDLAREILSGSSDAQGLLGICQKSIPQLCRIRGVGKIKAIQIQCIAELSKRIAKASAGNGRTFLSADAIAAYYMEDFRHLDQEEIMVLMFNTKGTLLGDRVVSRGTVNQSVTSPREIFLEAFSYHAVYIIMMHNHPSGDVTPSREDDAMTLRVRDAGEIIGIPLMDHIILGDKRYFSYREKGIIL